MTSPKASPARQQDISNIFENSPVGMAIVEGGRISFANESFAKYIRPPFNPRELIGQKLSDLIANSKLIESGLLEAQDSNEPASGHFTIGTSHLQFTIQRLEARHDQSELVIYISKLPAATSWSQNIHTNSPRSLHQLLRDIPIAITVFKNDNLELVVCNRESQRLWGRTENELLGKTARDLFSNHSRYEILRSVYENGKSVEGKESIATFEKFGHPYRGFYNFFYNPWIDEDGTVLGVIAVVFEVTEAVESRRALEMSEKELQQLANAMPQLVWIADENGAVDYYNDRLTEFAGATRLPDGHWMWEGLVHENDRESTQQAWHIAVSENSIYEKEHRIKMKDGSYRWHLSRAFPQRDASGKVVKWFGTATDIHDVKVVEEKLRRSENELRVSENYFKSLTQSLPQLVWTTDKNGEVDFFNEQWYQYTGSIPPESLGSKWTQYIHPDDIHHVSQGWHKSLSSQTPVKMELRLRKHDGNFHWFYVVGNPLRNENGEIVKWVGSITNIDDRKAFEQQLQQLVSERTRELERSNQDLQQFAHVASHDLKEPLRKILTFTHRLETELGHRVSPAGRTYLNKIFSATNRLNQMIEGVLTFSKADAVADKNEIIDLNEIIDEICIDLEVLMQQKSAVVLKRNLPLIEGARVLIYQLFYNMINNSLKFSKPNVPVEIQFEAKREIANGREWAIIKLIDNGIGFEPQWEDRIFETFFRLNSKDKFEGTGLGLALCKKIVNRHGGTISAKGEMDHGAEFTIRIPARQD